MSVIIHTRGETGGGVAAHLQCPLCGHFSKSHSHQLTHIATSHPTALDDVTVGRLGNILMYQSTARLFHCSDCFFTSRDFTKLYQHIISDHCMDEKEGGEGEEREGEEKEEEKDVKEGDRGKEEKGVEENRKMEDKEEGWENMEEDKKRRGGVEEDRVEEDKEKKEEKEGVEDSVEEDKEKKEEKGGEDRREEKDEGKTEESGEERKDEEGVTKRKRSSEGEEEEDGVGQEEGPTPEKAEPVKVGGEGDESVLVFDGAGYRCLLCNWRSCKKGPGINHVVRKHDIPRAYANQSLRQHMEGTLKQTQGGGAAEEEEGAVGLSGELLKEELEATAKVVRFISSRFVCLICGWKTKLKGFAISHVERSHDVEHKYRCKDCKRAFFLPSRLQHHISSAHRPGRYACPFCCFRSHFLGGFRRHCSRCNAREEGEEEGEAGGEEERNEEEEVEEVKETRKRRRVVRMSMEEEDEEEEED